MQIRDSNKCKTIRIYLVEPKSTVVAPLRDEVIFECAISLKPDGFKWRFQPQSGEPNQIKIKILIFVCFCVDKFIII